MQYDEIERLVPKCNREGKKIEIGFDFEEYNNSNHSILANNQLILVFLFEEIKKLKKIVLDLQNNS
jgi:hypothetical protein